MAVVVEIRDGLEGRGHTELHLLAVDGTRRWQVTGAGVDATDPRWSTGGTTLTFLADIGSRHRAAPFLLEVGPGRTRRASRDASPVRPGSRSSSARRRTARRCCS